MNKKLWGGRFKKKTDPLVEEFTKSIRYDHNLAGCDLIGSKIHVKILNKVGILSNAEAKKITAALQQIHQSFIKGKFRYNPKSEDIHTDIQNKLEKKIGDLALKLHTARSRNDQVVFATKLFTRVELPKLLVDVTGLSDSLLALSEKNYTIIMPGFTHLQHAQPVLLSDYICAYVEMLKRDYDRLSYILKNIKITMGAGALAGTPIGKEKYKINISEALKDIGDFAIECNIQPTANSLDAVSDRDFVIEVLSALSVLGMHLSRLAEDFIIWSTEEFDFIELDESFCTGSSLMPQKKNPDVLELVRGYTGRLYGNLVSVLTMMKGLPLAYNRDMQLDKEPLFDSIEIVSKELRVLAGFVRALKFNKEKIEEHLKDESLYATDLVYYLVERGIAFSNAHTIVGKLVRYSIDNSIAIKNMTETELKKFSDKFAKKEIIKLFDPKVSVESKRSIQRHNFIKELAKKPIK
jgi:argininosuccinate lyase